MGTLALDITWLKSTLTHFATSSLQFMVAHEVFVINIKATLKITLSPDLHVTEKCSHMADILRFLIFLLLEHKRQSPFSRAPINAAPNHLLSPLPV